MRFDGDFIIRVGLKFGKRFWIVGIIVEYHLFGTDKLNVVPSVGTRIIKVSVNYVVYGDTCLFYVYVKTKSRRFWVSRDKIKFQIINRNGKIINQPVHGVVKLPHSPRKVLFLALMIPIDL